MSGVGKSSGPGAATSSGIIEEPREGITTATAEENAGATQTEPVDTAERASNEREAPPPGVRNAFNNVFAGFNWRHGLPVRSNKDRGDLALTRNDFETTFSAADRAAINDILAKGSSATSKDLDQLVEIVGHGGDPATALSALYWQFNWVDNHQGIETWSALEYLAKQKGVCRDTANFNTYILSRHGIEAKTIGYAAPGGIAHAVTLYKDPQRGKWTLLEYTRGGHTDDSVYFDTMEEAAGNLIPGAFKFWIYDDPKSGGQRPADAAGILWTEHGLELDNFFVNRNVLRSGNTNRDGWYGNVSERSTTMSADFGKFSFDLRHYHEGVMPQIGGSLFVAGRYGDESADGRSGGSLSLFAGYMPNTWSRTVGPRQADETSTTVFGVGFERREELLDFGPTSESLRFTSLFDTSGAAVGAVDHGDGGFDKGVAAGLSYWDLTLRNQLTYSATKDVDLWLSHTTHVPLAETVVRIAAGGNLEGIPISHFAEVGGRFRLGSFTNETALYVPISIHNNLFHDDLRLDNTLDLQLTGDTRAVLEAYGDVSGLDSWGVNLGVRHGNVLATVGYADDGGRDTFSFKLGIDF